jgi:hypothetical protein
MNAVGSFTYTPNANYNGSDSFTYEIQDDRGGIDQATVNITITPVNDAPTGGADNFITSNNGALTFTDNTLLANDIDVEGDPLTIVAHTNPANGFLTDDGSGNYIYTPNPTFVGVDTFNYTVEDSNGAQSTVFVVFNVTDSGEPEAPTGTGGPDPEPETPPDSETPTVESGPETEPVYEQLIAPKSGGSQTAQPAPVEETTTAEPTLIAAEEIPEPVVTIEAIPPQEVEPEQFVNINKFSGVELQGYNMEKVNDEVIVLALNQMGEEMDSMGSNNGALIGSITTGSGFMLTAGIVSWVLRGGALASAMVASMPMLKMMDPLPFVAARRRKKEKEDEDKEMTDTQRMKMVKNDQWTKDIGAEKLFAGDIKPQGQ